MESVLDGKGDGVEREPLLIAAVLGASLAAGIVDQDAAHGLGGGGEEMPPTVPVLGVLTLEQTEVRLVDQSRGLKGLPGLFLGQLLCGQPAQLVIDQREQLPGGPRVA